MDHLFALFPAEGWIKLMPGLAAYAVMIGMPLVVPGWIAWRNRLPRKLLFAVLVPGLLYGWLLFLGLLWVPIQMFAVHVVPTLKANDLPHGAPVLPVIEWLNGSFFLSLPLAAALGSVILSRYLGRRWPGIVSALAAAHKNR